MILPVLLLALLAAPALGATIEGRIVGVVGDTVTLLVDRQQVRVRLAEIDAPKRRGHSATVRDYRWLLFVLRNPRPSAW